MPQDGYLGEPLVARGEEMHSELELGEDGSPAQVAHDPEAVCEGHIAA